MTLAETLGGPVSAYIEGEVRKEAQQNGILAWLDVDKHYVDFVERLVAARSSGVLPYPVYRFRGSHLELMLELENAAQGSEMSPMVVYFPGFNETSIGDTPLYELYAAGKRYRKALGTAVTEAAAGKVRPDQITTFLSQPDVSLENADTWLTEQVTHGEAGLGSQLNAMQLTAIVDDLLSKTGFLAARATQEADQQALLKHFTVKLGLPEARGEGTLLGDLLPGHGGLKPYTAQELAFLTAAWAMFVEYTNDLKRAPAMSELGVATSLPAAVIKNCTDLTTHLRNNQPDFYRPTARDAELRLEEERSKAKAEDLGKVDTFRFEEEAVLRAALEGLITADTDHAAYERAAHWAKLRLQPKPGAGSFWLKEDPTRNSAWQLVEAATNLGLALHKAGSRLGTKASLDEAVSSYAERGAQVDRAHRVLEQRRVALLFPQLPDFDKLRTALEAMRQRWRRWADAWAEDFNDICRGGGFIPASNLQQRTIFNDVVKPLAAEPGTTAFFMVDALRYEMGQELFELLKNTPQSTVELKPRLAELPTVTEVGMNVLAPVVNGGRLAPAFSSETKLLGFSTGEYRVSSIDTRKRAMHAAVGGKTCPWEALEDLVNLDPATLKKKVAQARLLVVHSREIDNAGEKGVGPAVFDVVLQRLRAAWQLLRDAGVKRFVITSDHGFLLVAPNAGSAQSHGRPIDPHRRHVFSSVAADHTGEVRVPLSDLGYLDTPLHVMFPETTAVFDTGKSSQNFVHGGNSPQERVIPVLTIMHRVAAGGSLLKYRVQASRQRDVAGMHRMKFTLSVEAQTALDFGSSKTIELALRAPGSEHVQVELVQAQTSGGARVKHHARSLEAPVGVEVEVFFRLLADGGEEQRVPIELFHPGAAAEVLPFVTDERFTVSASTAPSDKPKRPKAPPPEPDPIPRAPATAAAQSQDVVESQGVAESHGATESRGGSSDETWLATLPAWARPFFKHLQTHKTMTEVEAIKILGSARVLRRLSKDFEEHAQKAPFLVKIEMSAGVKQYTVKGNK